MNLRNCDKRQPEVVKGDKATGGARVPYPSGLQQHPGMMHEGGMRHQFLRVVAKNTGEAKKK
jgi:hypothetical protein